MIRRTAHAIAERNGEDANIFWRQTIADLRVRMRSDSVSEEAIERELRAFSESVFRHIG